jgi:hypothetical protein
MRHRPPAGWPFSHGKSNQVGTVVEGLRQFETKHDAESLARAKLRTLEAGPDVLSPGERLMIRAALQEAAYHKSQRHADVSPASADRCRIWLPARSAALQQQGRTNLEERTLQSGDLRPDRYAS